MLESTPLNCPENPGEPGGEKARVAKELFDSLSDHAPIPTVLLNQEQFTRAVTGALAACALAEAKWWHEWYGQEHSDSHIILERMGRNGCAVCQRLAALERAAEGK